MLKYNSKLKNECTNLVLFTSESCNLNCSYCDISKHLNNEYHKQEAKNVRDSLLNGQYLDTLKKAFERLEVNTLTIQMLELWGQEPTLTLNEFSSNFAEIYKMCPNIDKVLYSTNGIAFIDRSINFAKLIDKVVNKPCKLSIQFSYDGKESTEAFRGISSKIILNNIENLIRELNKTTFNYLSVEILLHNVISLNLINKYSNEDNYEGLINLFQSLSDLSDFFINLNTNKSVEIHPFGSAIEVPYNATQEEGKNLVKFYNNCEKYCKNVKHKNWKGLKFQTLFKMRDNLIWSDDILNYVASFYEPSSSGISSLNRTLLSNTSRAIGCGFGCKSLKIRYDGTLMHCQNGLYSLDEQSCNRDSEENYLVSYRKRTKGFFPNVLTDTDDEIDKYLSQCYYFNEESFPQKYSQVCNLMKLLLNANQIDPKYNDARELLKAAYYISLSTTCVHNSMMWTGSLTGTHAGLIRLYCNGFLDIIQAPEEEFREGEEKCS